MPAGAAQKEEEKKNEETGYLPASDPSFLIQKSKDQTKSAPKNEMFVPDFDLDEVPDLEWNNTFVNQAIHTC